MAIPHSGRPRRWDVIIKEAVCRDLRESFPSFKYSQNLWDGRQTAVLLSKFIKAPSPLFFGGDDFFPRECIAVILRNFRYHLLHIHTGNTMLASINLFNMNGFHVRVPEAFGGVLKG